MPIDLILSWDKTQAVEIINPFFLCCHAKVESGATVPPPPTWPQRPWLKTALQVSIWREICLSKNNKKYGKCVKNLDDIFWISNGISYAKRENFFSLFVMIKSDNYVWLVFYYVHCFIKWLYIIIYYINDYIVEVGGFASAQVVVPNSQQISCLDGSFLECWSAGGPGSILGRDMSVPGPLD